MVIVCSAYGCSNRYKPSTGICFHRFPVNNSRLLKKWVVAMQRENWHPTKNSFLCSNHFSQGCYKFDECKGRRRGALLKDDAIPDTFVFDKQLAKQGRVFIQNVSENVQHETEMKSCSEKCSQNEGNCGTNVEAQPKDIVGYCRLCASQNIREMFEIFSEEENSYIAEKISRCLPVIILPTDNLPLHICRSCVNKLNTSYDLIITALKAEEFLKTNYSTFENSQSSNKVQGECVYKGGDEIVEDQKPYEGNLDAHEKQVVCEIVLEDKRSMKIKRLLKDKHEQKKDGLGNLPCEESCVDLHNTDRPVKLIKVKGFSAELNDDTINIEGPATCDLCDITYFDMEAFDQHILNVHFVQYKQKCSLCDEGFEEPKDLLAHKISKHPDNMKTCGSCDLRSPENNRDHSMETFKKSNVNNSEHNYSESFTKSEVQYRLKCKFCDAVYESKNSFRDHKCMSEEELPQCRPVPAKHTCVPKETFIAEVVPSLQNDCKERNHENRGFVLHPKNRNEETNFNVSGNIQHRKTKTIINNSKPKKIPPMQCVTCHKVFTNETFYKRHRYIHDQANSDRHRCKVCKCPFHDTQALTNHMQLHSGNKPYMCDLCGRTYNRYANMLKHRKLHKPSNQWEHSCSHCQVKFEKLNDLMAHLERSHNFENIESKSESNKLMRKQVKWICRFCGKRVSTKLCLQDHERIHTGLKPFICEWCGREFRSKPNLLQHHLTHTGDRKHACDVCGKKFARKSFVVQHMRVHTGEKPYECNICGQRFTQSGDMRRHRRRHLEVKLNAAYYVDVPTQDKTILVKVHATP